jgi:hypothetical protein
VVPLTTQDACALLQRNAVVRPKQRIRRDRQFNIKLTEREFELLYTRAAACRMRPVDYGRAHLFSGSTAGSKAAPCAAHLDPLFYAQLSRLGNNLNQIARRLNTQGGSAPSTLEPLLRDIRALINRGAPE